MIIYFDFFYWIKDNNNEIVIYEFIAIKMELGLNTLENKLKYKELNKIFYQYIEINS